MTGRREPAGKLQPAALFGVDGGFLVTGDDLWKLPGNLAAQGERAAAKMNADVADVAANPGVHASNGSGDAPRLCDKCGAGLSALNTIGLCGRCRTVPTI